MPFHRTRIQGSRQMIRLKLRSSDATRRVLRRNRRRARWLARDLHSFHRHRRSAARNRRLPALGRADERCALSARAGLSYRLRPSRAATSRAPASASGGRSASTPCSISGAPAAVGVVSASQGAVAMWSAGPAWYSLGVIAIATGRAPGRGGKPRRARSARHASQRKVSILKGEFQSAQQAGRSIADIASRQRRRA